MEHESAPVCWVLTDGRAGNRAQALAFAEAMARLEPLAISEKRVRLAPPWRTALRRLSGDPFARLAPGSDPVETPYPDIVVGCGRAAAPIAIAVKKKRPSTFAVQLLNPRSAIMKFDLVVAPAHDRLAGNNVLSIIGAPVRAAGRVPKADRLRRNVAVLIGGPNRAFGFDANAAAKIGGAIAALAGEAVDVSVTTSRRTPPASAESLRRSLQGVVHRFWRADKDDAADNPYPAMLGEADFILVTEDSVNMAAEAASTGTPVYILRLPRKPFASARKFDAFHESLQARGAARYFEGRLDHFHYEPLDETSRAAKEAVRRWREFASRSRVR